MAQPISVDQAEAAEAELRAIGKLVESEGWKLFVLPLLAKKEAEHLGGLSALASAPEKRAEHVHAYHLALDLPKAPEARMETLRGLLSRFRRQGE